MVIRDGFKVPPESYAKVTDVRMYLRSPFQQGTLSLKWTFGAEGCPMKTIEFKQDGIETGRICHNFSLDHRRS